MGDFVEDPNKRQRIRTLETGQTNDCAGNNNANKDMEGDDTVYTEMHLKQTLVARAHSIFYDYEVGK